MLLVSKTKEQGFPLEGMSKFVVVDITKAWTGNTLPIIRVCLLVGCLTSQQQASVSQGRYHTRITPTTTMYTYTSDCVHASVCIYMYVFVNTRTHLSTHECVRVNE